MIKTIFSKVKNFAKNNKWWTALITLILIIILFSVFGPKKSSAAETVTVTNRDITEVVSATGNVTPLSDLDLAFQASGEVSDVAVSVGDKVSKGEYLASLSNADLAAAVEQAKAGLAIAQANLASLQSGSTADQIAVSQSQEQEAQSTVSDSAFSLANAIQDVYAKSDDAIRNDTDVMFDNPRSENPSLQFQTDFQLGNTIIAERAVLEPILTAWSSSTANVEATSSNLSNAVNTANTNLNTIQTFLTNLALAVNNLPANNQTSQSSFESESSASQDDTTVWKDDVSTARSEISVALSNLSSAASSYQSGLSALVVAQNQLAVTQSPATADQIAAQQATVEQAQANVDAAQAQFNKSIITSPIDGTITAVNADVGETIESGSAAISVISFGQYDVEAYVPEADIAKVQIGDPATTTLDAYGSDTFFPTSVIKIDPAETIIEDVPTYKVTLAFASSSDARIKSGMTANLDILTDQKDGVLAVPSRSVYEDDTQQEYVQLVNPTNPKDITQTAVQTGIRGVDGYVEIISGLEVGDTIIASPNQ